jgi:hypothetical protein
MKRILTFAVLFLFTMIAFAGNVSEQQALQKAMAFFESQQPFRYQCESEDGSA